MHPARVIRHQIGIYEIQNNFPMCVCVYKEKWENTGFSVFKRIIGLSGKRR